MTVGLVADPAFERHETGAGHPERPGRSSAIREALEREGLRERCTRIDPVPIDEDLLRRVHEPAYVDAVSRPIEGSLALLDGGDTVVGAESARIAKLAAGSAVEACRRVLAGELSRAFLALRPPGHHAERDRAMGFCLFNNVAVAARYLLDQEGCERVLIVDWDVHHGNGTQHLFESSSEVLFYSSHQMPLYPGTGAADEVGTDEGRGFTLNKPLRAGSGNEPFISGLNDVLVPAAERFRPDFVLVSAGFDAHRDDPLAALEVDEDGFREATEIVLRIARRHAGGRCVSLLEGGYHLDALARSVAVHVEALLAEDERPD